MLRLPLSGRLNISALSTVCFPLKCLCIFSFKGSQHAHKGSECWYGNDLNPLATAADPSTCNKPCAGNSAQTCGGPDRLNLYVAIAEQQDLDDLDSPFPYEPDDCRRVENVNYNHRACLVRGFPAPTASITRTMYPTMEKCAVFCDDFSSFCNSFSFNAATRECTLYQETTWEVVTPLTGSIAYKDIFISDRQCWVCPPRG